MMIEGSPAKFTIPKRYRLDQYDYEFMRHYVCMFRPLQEVTVKLQSNTVSTLCVCVCVCAVH
jgi:hypothetical protein